MTASTRERSAKSGLEPGSPIHVGERKADEVTITLTEYDETRLEEREVESLDACFPRADSSLIAWIHVTGLHQTTVLQQLSECLGVHPLTVEDILNANQRPKVEDFGSYVYIVLKMFHHDGKDTLESEQISLVLGPGFVASIREAQGDVFGAVRDRLTRGVGRIRKEGADYLAYALLDSIVDSYFGVLERIGEQTEQMEEELLSQPTERTLPQIHHLKRTLILLHKSVWPLREVISGLERGSTPLIKDSTRLYLRDVYDHVIQVMETIETFRDMLSELLDICLSSLGQSTNASMKVLTIISTIFMPLSFIAGVYGMNFRHMPELERRWGYPLALVLMLGVGVTMLLYFRRKKWL